MERTNPHSATSTISVLAAWTAIAASGAALALLLSLHVLSPEYSPAWRMISEYANGQYGWVLSLMFIAYGAGSLTLAIAIASSLKTRRGKFFSRPCPVGLVGNRSSVGRPVRSQPGGTSRVGGSGRDPVSAAGGYVDQPQPGGDWSEGGGKEVDLARVQSDLDQRCPLGCEFRPDDCHIPIRVRRSAHNSP